MKKYYRAYIDIDLNAICHNLNEARAYLTPNTKIMAVIKADGYGHGAIPIAKTLQEKVDYFGVAQLEEAVLLRTSGIQIPILILGFTSHNQYEQLINNNISQTIYDFDMAQSISKKAMDLGKEAKLHIKIDTGMNRIGFFDNEDTIEIIKKIRHLPNIIVEGIFTHFACADMTDKGSVNKQIDKFTKFIQKLKDENIEIPIKHASNSAGIIELPHANFDMVRMGISLYGLYPSDEVRKDILKLKPSLSLKSYVIYVKTVPKDTLIGYSSTYVTKKETVVATISLGYGDGYPRNLSSIGRVLINGKSAPIIGRICMDQFMVDVSEISDIKKGDLVTLVGSDGDESISVEELSNLVKSFNYEFVCGLGKRIPRVYYKDGEIIETIDYFY